MQVNRHILRKMHVVVLKKCESGADKTEIDCNVHIHGIFTPRCPSQAPSVDHNLSCFFSSQYMFSIEGYQEKTA